MDTFNKKGTGIRHNSNKVRTDFLSPIAMLGTAEVFTKGSDKYTDHNWRLGMPWSKPIASVMRHWFNFMRGLDYDVDPNCEGCKNKSCKEHTGCLNIDCVAANISMLQEYARTHKDLDDRFKV